jgi:ribosomal protein L29
METVSKQEYMRILSELDLLTTKFVALEQENQKLLGDLQQVSVEKAQQHEELSKRVQQLEAVVLSLRQQASTSQSLLKEPKISLPTKFDGTRSQFRGFLNQVRLIIHMHPNRFPSDAAQVGLVGTLLTGTALAWFAPLLEKKSPILENFDTFINEFQASFGDTDSVRTAINKIRRLRQGDRPASAYAADFRLLACDIP